MTSTNCDFQIAKPRVFFKRPFHLWFSLALFSASLLLICRNVNAVPDIPINLLYVTDWNYQEEQLIYTHLEDINYAAGGGYYSLSTIPTSQLTGSFPLQQFDVLVISGFSAGISDQGISNVLSSGIPVVVIESGNFYYSYKLELVYSPQASPSQANYVTTFIPDHPVTFLMDSEVQVCDQCTIWGINEQLLTTNAIGLVFSMESYSEYTIIADDERSIVATGITDFFNVSAQGWVLLDEILDYLAPVLLNWQSTKQVVDEMLDNGLFDHLAFLSQYPGQWQYDDAMYWAWIMAFASNIKFTRADLFASIDKIMVAGWDFEPIVAQTLDGDVPDGIIWHPEGVDTCLSWYYTLRTDTTIIPDSIEYITTEAGGSIRLGVNDSVAEIDTTLFTGAADTFAISMGGMELANFAHKWRDDGEGGYELIGSVMTYLIGHGTSPLLHRNRLYSEYSTPGTVLSHWWGTNAQFFILPIDGVGHYPYDAVALEDASDPRLGWHQDIYLDFYKYAFDDTPKRRDKPMCFARFYDHDEAVPRLGSFDTELMPIDIPFNSTGDQCLYAETFNPLATDVGLPNVFTDAAAGSGPYGIKPRMQLVLPTNAFLNYMHPIEEYCNAHSLVCSDLSTHGSTFKSNFGIDDVYNAEYYDPEGRIRQGTSPWSTDGPWQVPVLKAGYNVQVMTMLRRETDSLPIAWPRSYVNTYCDLDKIEGGTSYPYNVVYLKYKDKYGSWHEPTSVEIDSCRAMGNCDGTSTYDHMITMPCFPLAADALEGIDYDVQADHGITYYSFNTTTTPTSSGIMVPIDAKGEARLIFNGSLIMRNDRGREDIWRDVTREFPVYIEPVAENTVVVDSRPACWVGATRDLYSTHPLYEDFVIDNKTVPSSFEYDSDPTYYNQLSAWLYGADEGAWLKTQDGVGAAATSTLFTLPGDAGIDRSGLGPDPNTSSNWFQYRGSGLAAYQTDYSGSSWWDGYNSAQCPVMEVEQRRSMKRLSDGSEEWVRTYPWYISRADGFNIENGWYDEGPPTLVEYCQETSAETVATVGGFQFDDQYEDGTSYIWMAVVSDWGNQLRFGAGEPGDMSDLFKQREPLTGLGLTSYLWKYGTEYTPWWGSFIGRWDRDLGIDDMGRSVSWACIRSDGSTGRYFDDACNDANARASTFLVNATIQVDDLRTALGDSGLLNGLGYPLEPNAGGVIVYHTGRYRSSGVYLSYAQYTTSHPDALYPELYRHFAGLDPATGNPQWTGLEGNAKPVLWDHVGEISAAYTPYMPPGEDPDPVFQDFKVLYNINLAYGQSGIVMRHSSDAYGPFSDPVPLFDCHTEIRDAWDNGAGIRIGISEVDYEPPPEKSLKIYRGIQGCYGGWTHPDLWNSNPASGTTTLRYNVSMPTAYKVLFVETEATTGY